jgi:hypothetical protein
VSLAGVPNTTFFPFSGIGNGNTCKYEIDDGAGNVEMGQGTYSSSGNTLSRDSVETSSNSNSLVNFGAGTKTVRLDVPASIFSAVPTSVVNDTNVTGSLSGNVLTLGWTGTLAAGRVSTLNQNTTGSAATLTTPRAIYGNNFDGSAALAQIITSVYGGTGNGFTKFSGPASSEKTFTLPNASANVLTDNAAVTVAQGGSGAASFTAYAVICGGTTSTGALQNVSGVGTSGQLLTSGGAGALPTWTTVSAGASVGNPGGGAQVNLVGANGSAATALRTDCVLILDQTIAPSMSGAWTFTNKSAVTITQAVIATASPASALTVTTGTHTALTAGSNFIAGLFDALTNQPQFATGAQSVFTPWVFKGSKPKYVGATTCAAFSTVDINSAGDATGTNCTAITNNYFLTCGGAASPVFSVNSVGSAIVVSGSNVASFVSTGVSCSNTGSGIANASFGVASQGTVAVTAGHGNHTITVGMGSIFGAQLTIYGSGITAALSAFYLKGGVYIGGTPGDCIIQAGNPASVANTNGANLVLAGGVGTGTGGGGDINFRYAAVGVSSSTPNTLATCMTISGTTGLVSKYNAVATAGLGVPAIYGQGRTVGATAAVSSVASYTLPATDGTYRVSANVLVTTATTHAFTVTVAYTSEDNTSRVLTLQFSNLAGTFITSIANAAGAVPYEGVPLHIRCKASTAITIASAAGGVYTAVAYNIEGIIEQLA